MFMGSVLCLIEREVNHMATFEERLAAIEQDNAELRQKIELQNMAIGGLINKAMLEKINEKNDKIFQALISHDQLTNQQLAEFREQLDQIDGKVVGMQTEMRQSFAAMNTRMDEMNTHMGEVDVTLKQILQLLTQKSDQ